MQDDATFDRAAVRQALAPDLDRVEAEALRHIKTIVRHGVIGFAFPIGAGAGLGVLSGFQPGAVAFGVFAGFMAMAIWWLMGLAKLLRFVADAQREAMAAAAKELGLTYERTPSTVVDLAAFKNTMFANVYEHTEPRDMISGVRGGLPFQIFEMKYFRRGAKGNPKRGVLKVLADVSLATVVRVELRGRWTSRMLVLRDIGPANALRMTGGLDRVRLVDPKFEKIFEVFSSDQTEARAVLTPSFMERLIALESLVKDGAAPAFGVFDDGAFMIAIPRFGASDESSSGDGQSLKEAIDVARSKIAVDKLLQEIEAVFAVADALTSVAPPRLEPRP